MSLSDALRLEDCCYTAACCGRVVCRETRPSPGEDEWICADCFDEHGPHGDCFCCERRLSPAQSIEAMTEALAAGLPPYDPAADTSIDRTPRPCGVCAGSGLLATPVHFYTRAESDAKPCWACAGKIGGAA